MNVTYGDVKSPEICAYMHWVIRIFWNIFTFLCVFGNLRFSGPKPRLRVADRPKRTNKCAFGKRSVVAWPAP